MSRALTECSNCAQRFEAQYPFCPYCGQQAENKLTIGVLFSNTISNYFSVDARFFKSYVPLMTKPGFLAKEFVDGKRILYLHPAQMYLFVSVVFFFLFSFISREQTQDIDALLKDNEFRMKEVRDSIQQQDQDSIAALRMIETLDKDQQDLVLKNNDVKKLISRSKNKGASGNVLGINFNQQEIDSMIDSGASDAAIYKNLGMKDSDGAFKKRIYKQGLKFMKNRSGGSVLQAFYDSIPIAMFVLLPIFAFILKIFYYNKGPFAYHLVFSFYYFAFLFMVFSILVLLSLFWKDFPGWIYLLVLVSTFFYFFFGVKRFYGQGYLMSFIKANVINFVFLSFVLPFATVIMGVMAFLFY